MAAELQPIDETQLQRLREEARHLRKRARQACQEAAELQEYARRIIDQSKALFAHIGIPKPPSRTFDDGPEGDLGGMAPGKWATFSRGH
jgi:hypothetical protein